MGSPEQFVQFCKVAIVQQGAFGDGFERGAAEQKIIKNLNFIDQRPTMVSCPTFKNKYSLVTYSNLIPEFIQP